MKLIDGSCGKSYTVKGMELEHGIKRRLEILGLTYNSEVLILNTKRNGSMIIRVRGTRFALGGKIAKGITVDEC